MRKTLPQYNENEYHNLTAGSSFVWKFVSRVKNSISVIPIFIPIPDPIRLYPDLGNTSAGQVFSTVKFLLEGCKLKVKCKNIFKTYFEPKKYQK